MTCCCNWWLAVVIGGSLWELWPPEVDFRTRCGNWGLQKSTHDSSCLAVVIEASRSREKQTTTNTNSTSWLDVVIGASKSQHMTRSGASQNQNSSSWLAVVIGASRSREQQTAHKLEFMARCGTWGLEKANHDSLWGLEESKLDFMTRCGAWGLQKPWNKTKTNSTSWIAVVVGASNSQAVIRCGASKIKTRLNDSLW